MNSEKVQTIITEIISELHNRIGGKAARKQYVPAKHQIEDLTRLGILELMPKGFGHADAKAVIEEAQRGKTAVMNAYGEGETIGASKLYQAINEVEAEVSEPFEIADFVSRADYLNQMAEEDMDYRRHYTWSHLEYTIARMQEDTYLELIREFTGRSPQAMIWQGKKSIYYQHPGNLKMMSEVYRTLEKIKFFQKWAGRELTADEIRAKEAEERAAIEYLNSEAHYAEMRKEAEKKQHSPRISFSRKSVL